MHRYTSILGATLLALASGIVSPGSFPEATPYPSLEGSAFSNGKNPANLSLSTRSSRLMQKSNDSPLPLAQVSRQSHTDVFNALYWITKAARNGNETAHTFIESAEKHGWLGLNDEADRAGNKIQTTP